MTPCMWNCPGLEAWPLSLSSDTVVSTAQLLSYCPVMGGPDRKWGAQTHTGSSVREGEGLTAQAPALRALGKPCG